MTLWVESFSITIFIINRLPTLLLDNKSPFELLYKHPPSYASFYTFGCRVYPAYRITPKPNSNLVACLASFLDTAPVTRVGASIQFLRESIPPVTLILMNLFFLYITYIFLSFTTLLPCMFSILPPDPYTRPLTPLLLIALFVQSAPLQIHFTRCLMTRLLHRVPHQVLQTTLLPHL